MNIIGYAYSADCHCVECTSRDAAVGFVVRQPPLKMDVDQHGIAFDLVDREGNAVHPIFSNDPSNSCCGDCGVPLR